VVVFWSLEATVATAQNQQPTTPASESASMATFRQAFQKTRTANTVDELSHIIGLCQQGLEGGGSEAELKYGRDLLAWSYNKRGELLATAGQDEEALSDFETSVKLDPTRASAYHNRGVSFGMMGDYDAAMADFNKVLQLSPNHAKAYYNRGEVRFKRGDVQGAIEDYSRCARLAPNDPAVYTSRGFAYASLRDFRNAISDYGRAAQADPRNAEAYTHRGDAYADLGEFGRAMNDYQAAIRVDPKFDRAHLSLGWLRATCPVGQFRNADFALQSVRKAIELNGEETYQHLDALAAAEANAGQFDAATATQKRALAAAPSEGALAEEIDALQRRLQLYEAGQPFRTPEVRPNASPNVNSVQPRQRPARGRPR
jgi:tetratricopeptide (TPR) repeat protein